MATKPFLPFSGDGQTSRRVADTSGGESCLVYLQLRLPEWLAQVHPGVRESLILVRSLVLESQCRLVEKCY